MTSYLERLPPVPKRLRAMPGLGCICIWVLGILTVTPALADIAVVTGESTPLDAIAQADAQALWLGTIERVEGLRLAVADRSDAEIRDEFYRRVLDKTRGQVKAVRAKRAFQYGIAPPPEFPNDESVLDWVRARENRLGYVDAESADDTVKVLLVIKVPKRSESP